MVLRKRGNKSSVAKFYSNDADKHPSLHVGVAQCTIPYRKFLKVSYLGFVSKLFGNKKKMMPMRINYINEMEVDDPSCKYQRLLC